MAANIDPTGIGNDMFRGTTFVEALGLDPQQVSDAVEEAEKHGLVEVMRAPNAPFSFSVRTGVSSSGISIASMITGSSRSRPSNW